MTDLNQVILKVPDPRLRTRTPEEGYGVNQGTFSAMLKALRSHVGMRAIAGLSSVQMAMPGRVIFWLDEEWRGQRPQDARWRGLVNPEVISRSYETAVEREGCFSLADNLWVPVRRSVRITLRGVDVNTAQHFQTVELTGFSARFALHELDHLDGILITDYLP